MGRFVHEGAAVDSSGIVYLTEDNGEPLDGFYRFLPKRPGRLEAGGVLQMLAIDGSPQYSTLTGQPADVSLPVVWVTIEEPDPVEAEVDPSAVFNQGYEEGGAAFLGVKASPSSGATCTSSAPAVETLSWGRCGSSGHEATIVERCA